MAGTGNTVTADGLVESIGVNTHIPYSDGNYADVSLIASNLSTLGINQVRDQITNGENGTAPLSSYITLANDGIKFTIYIEEDSNSHTSSNAYVLGRLSLIDQLETAVPGSVTAIEGPNEVNNEPLTWVLPDGSTVTGLQAALDEQQAIVTDVANDPILKGTPIDYFTGYDSTSPNAVGTGPDPVSSGLATYDNQHPYPTNNGPPAGALLRSSSLPNTTNANEPTVYTETGYSTNDVSPAVQAKYELDLIMDAVADGVNKTYLYELMDAYPPGSRQGDGGWGLFSYGTKDNQNPANDLDTAKPVATAISNLTTILKDTGANAASFTPTKLNYSYQNLPSDGNTFAIEQSDGNYFVAVWAEPQISGNSSGTLAPVIINLPTGYHATGIYDPYTGTTTAAAGQSVLVGVTDHPLLVEVSPNAVCFHRGTSILTATGEVPVEALKIGDKVVTRSGAHRPIKWIGRRSYSGPLAKANKNLAPVCFKQGALGDNVPTRDLWVSGPHAMYLLGALIPASLLVNGQSIVRIEDYEEIHYFHVELDSHDVIFAEGAATETFYDEDGRGVFQNAAEFSSLYPGLDAGLRRDYFAPRLEEGFELEALRESLRARAGRLQADGVATPVHLDGFLDVANRTQVAGWAWDRASPDRRVEVIALCNGVVVARTQASQFRDDLLAAEIGDGRHAFELHWDLPLARDARHEIELRHADDFTPLQGSPLFIEPEAALISVGGELQGHLDAASTTRVTGWALNAENPHQPVGLIITVDGQVIGRAVANRHRDDLSGLAIGTGRHAFEFNFLPNLTADQDHVIEIQREIDRVHLPNSPLTFKAGDEEHDHSLEEVLGEVLARTASAPDQAKALELLNELSYRLSRRPVAVSSADWGADHLRKAS